MYHPRRNPVPICATFGWLIRLQGPHRETGVGPLRRSTVAALKLRQTKMAHTATYSETAAFPKGALSRLTARSQGRNGAWMIVLACATVVPLISAITLQLVGVGANAIDPTPYAVCVALVGMSWLVAANQRAVAPVSTYLNAADLAVAEAKLAEMVAQCAELERQLNLDPLTGAHNRRSLEKAFHAHGTGMVMALLDIDHFKKINDTYGHAVGDRVLKDFTRLLRARLSDELPIYRVGGEEFVVYFPEGDLEAVAARLDKFRSDLALDCFSRTTDRVPVSFSAGLALHDDARLGFGDIFKMVDDRLYSAKMAGRGQTVYADPHGQGALAAAG